MACSGMKNGGSASLRVNVKMSGGDNRRTSISNRGVARLSGTAPTRPDLEVLVRLLPSTLWLTLPFLQRVTAFFGPLLAFQTAAEQAR